ncbi:FAD dependent oxidoreductase [Tanacetum coccineum]
MRSILLHSFCNIRCAVTQHPVRIQITPVVTDLTAAVITASKKTNQPRCVIPERPEELKYDGTTSQGSARPANDEVQQKQAPTKAGKISKSMRITKAKGNNIVEIRKNKREENLLKKRQALSNSQPFNGVCVLAQPSTVEKQVIRCEAKGCEDHLLVIENFNSFRLNHDLMEAGYVGHQDSTFKPKNFDAKTSSISMTATMDTLGNFILVPDGKPMIRHVPGLLNVFIAAGHEG